MFRSFRAAACLAMVCVAFRAPLLRADTAEDGWKQLVMQALYASGEKDFAKAEKIFLEALHEAERFGADDPRVGTTYNSLGLVYRSEKKAAEAETTYRKALAILEKTYGETSIDAGNVCFNIAGVMMDQGKYDGALPYLQRTLTVYQQQLGSNSPKTASVMCMIGDSYRLSKDFKAAEGPLKRCADIREADGGLVNSDLGDALFSLALVYQKQGKYGLADPVFKLSEKIREKTQGIMSPVFAETLEAHAAMLKEMGRDPEAQKDAALAAAIRRNEHRGK